MGITSNCSIPRNRGINNRGYLDESAPSFHQLEDDERDNKHESPRYKHPDDPPDHPFKSPQHKVLFLSKFQ